MGEMNHLSHIKLSVGIINIKCLGLFLKYNKHSVVLSVVIIIIIIYIINIIVKPGFL